MEIIMLFLGLAFAGLGGFLLWDDTLFRLHAHKGVGRIIAFKTTIGRQGRARFWPIVSCRHRGEKHLLTARRKKDVLNKKLGDKVSIDIPTEDAAQVRLKIQLSILLSGLFLLAGLICTIAGAYLNVEKWQFMQQAINAKGIVTAYDRHADAPIVSFTPAQTRSPITFTDKTHTNTSQFSVGSQVNVLYLSHEPQQAIIDRGSLNWLGSAFFMLFGLVITISSATLFKRLVHQPLHID